ncbi:uncharacterized protein KNAG_0B02280 [Huiozyma naganishii CBS 8797]|uniref:Uncharacterized protein n=1 Tax=Huiozyma naganishii (strain ATCC MYA-139 / BCRC 22969 / CBS 8797 / KCTC 17520 / NBRC 10181 / NCYC 3082 / Yp74L-3) TaxID=1071383 RepID=J7R1H6_HUIN7|nr:hypothetical protein KNAG_0B02280 [Kazachstania naganishii CBS 8797]CCK68670.1 hypothetical protein KNAG_0B02280 [Kazachstania naganishii CBS 8797]
MPGKIVNVAFLSQVEDVDEYLLEYKKLKQINGRNNRFYQNKSVDSYDRKFGHENSPLSGNPNNVAFQNGGNNNSINYNGNIYNTLGNFNKQTNHSMGYGKKNMYNGNNHRNNTNGKFNNSSHYYQNQQNDTADFSYPSAYNQNDLVANQLKQTYHQLFYTENNTETGSGGYKETSPFMSTSEPLNPQVNTSIRSLYEDVKSSIGQTSFAYGTGDQFTGFPSFPYQQQPETDSALLFGSDLNGKKTLATGKESLQAPKGTGSYSGAAQRFSPYLNGPFGSASLSNSETLMASLSPTTSNDIFQSPNLPSASFGMNLSPGVPLPDISNGTVGIDQQLTPGNNTLAGSKLVSSKERALDMAQPFSGGSKASSINWGSNVSNNVSSSTGNGPFGIWNSDMSVWS